MNLAYNQNYQYRGEHFSEIIPHMMQVNTREILVHKGGRRVSGESRSKSDGIHWILLKITNFFFVEFVDPI